MMSNAKNIVDNLLKSNGDDKEQQKKTKKKPLEVEVSLTVQSVENISTVQQTVDVGILLDVYWKYEKLGAPTWDWESSFQTVNAVQVNERQVRRQPHRSTINGFEQWHAQIWISTTFKQSFSILSFPFDCQTILIRFEMGSVEEMIYCPVTGRDTFLSIENELCPLSDWNWVGANVVTTATDRKLSKQNKSYSQMILCLHIARDWKHYIWRAFMFVFLFSLSSLIPFALDPVEEFGDRISVTLTVILTQIAFMFSISSSLPTTKQICILEVYILLSVVINFAVLFETSVCKMLDRHDFHLHCETSDPYFGFAMTVFLAIEHIFVVGCCFVARSRGIHRLNQGYQATPPQANIQVAAGTPWKENPNKDGCDTKMWKSCRILS